MKLKLAINQSNMSIMCKFLEQKPVVMAGETDTKKATSFAAVLADERWTKEIMNKDIQQLNVEWMNDVQGSDESGHQYGCGRWGSGAFIRKPSLSMWTNQRYSMGAVLYALSPNQIMLHLDIFFK